MFLESFLSDLKEQGSSWLNDAFAKDTYTFNITGLSRSGKSMLFTSLMHTLNQRTHQQVNCLPLLKKIPQEQVKDSWIEPIQGLPLFPLEKNLKAMENGEWPEPTQSLSGFKFVIELRETREWKKHFFEAQTLVLKFIDYPGEWVTDLPMLNKTYRVWSDSTWAQQETPPQSHFSQEWKQCVSQFDFDQAPTAETIDALLNQYRFYLIESKQGGITMLQPGGMILPPCEVPGFVPLPSKITSDASHPWTEVMTRRYERYKKEWLKPFKEDVFVKADKQIILMDLFEGLNYSRNHLEQLKETVSHIAEVFAYDQLNWFEKNLMSKDAISKVAFVASKADLVPESQKGALMSLLKEMTQGARANLSTKPVEVEHFLLSSIQATFPGEDDMSLNMALADTGRVNVTFEPLPESLTVLKPDENYPSLSPLMPKDFNNAILNNRGLDRLLNYLMES